MSSVTTSVPSEYFRVRGEVLLQPLVLWVNREGPGTQPLRDTRVGDEEAVLPPFGETVETVCPVNEQLWGTLVLGFDFVLIVRCHCAGEQG